jgi:hypothetical protein
LTYGRIAHLTEEEQLSSPAHPTNYAEHLILKLWMKVKYG